MLRRAAAGGRDVDVDESDDFVVEGDLDCIVFCVWVWVLECERRVFELTVDEEDETAPCFVPVLSEGVVVWDVWCFVFLSEFCLLYRGNVYVVLM